MGWGIAFAGLFIGWGVKNGLELIAAAMCCKNCKNKQK